MMLLCQRCYVEQDDQPKNDFMLNPYVTPKELLLMFPKIYFLICEKDPLHDGSLKLGLKFL